ncbi:MAG: LLM class flavin-dependent oxidoreductase [Ilumatobacteraceae bacterium]
MRFSIWPNSERSWVDVREVAHAVEDMGWDGLWYADHYMPNTADGATAPGDFHECFSVLSALAAVTSRLRLGSLVAPTTMNHPAILANRAATIDQISGGRFVLGIGAGWQVNEHKAFGVDLMAPKDRVDRFAEAIEIIASMLTNERTTVEGRHFTVTDAPCEPKSVQSPLPLLVGTGSPRMLRLTARFAHEWNTWGTPDGAAAVIDRLNAACEKEGRDPATMRKSVQALFFVVDDAAAADMLRSKVPADRSVVGSVGEIAEVFARYRDLGFDEVCVPDFTLGASSSERIDNYGKIWSGAAVGLR